MAVIDSRLKDCDTDQDVTENFNRILNLLDNVSAVPSNLIILTKDNSTITEDNGTYTIKNQELHDALLTKTNETTNNEESDNNFKLLFVNTGTYLDSYSISFGEVISAKDKWEVVFSSGTATEDLCLLEAGEGDETTLTIEQVIAMVIEE